MSTNRFGCSSSIRDTSPRSSAAQPTWAPTKVVAGCRPTSRSNAARSSSNGGKPASSGRPAGRVGQKCQSGCSRSSSQRSFAASSGSKNAIGSAMWMTTGRSSAAAVAHSGSSRSSSTATSRPCGSRARSPSDLPDLEPARPAGDRIAQPGRLGLAERGIVGPAVVVEPGEDGQPVRRGGLPALDLARQAVAQAAVEVDERLDPGCVEHRQELGRDRARPSRRRTRRPRWLWASIAGNRGWRQLDGAGTRELTRVAGSSASGIMPSRG